MLDVCYGPANGCNSEQVQRWANALSKLNDKEIYEKWKEPYPSVLGGLLPSDNDRGATLFFIFTFFCFYLINKKQIMFFTIT